MLQTEPYVIQSRLWPQVGQHILAQQDEHSLIVYQAYRPEIADYAVRHGRFGGAYSYSRMSWIKPNFLWMMFRSGWATKEGQERVLALRISRAFFDRILSEAVASNIHQSVYSDHASWKAALAASEVRLQWDPDHAPDGSPVPRRAIQLGLRGEILADFGQRELLQVMDVTSFVRERHGLPLQKLDTPAERVYFPVDRAIANNIGLDQPIA